MVVNYVLRKAYMLRRDNNKIYAKPYRYVHPPATRRGDATANGRRVGDQYRLPRLWSRLYSRLLSIYIGHWHNPAAVHTTS